MTHKIRHSYIAPVAQPTMDQEQYWAKNMVITGTWKEDWIEP